VRILTGFLCPAGNRVALFNANIHHFRPIVVKRVNTEGNNVQ
jgi:hypothetical protein